MVKVRIIEDAIYSVDFCTPRQFKKNDVIECTEFEKERLVNAGFGEIIPKDAVNEEVAEPIQAPKKKGKKKSNDAVVEEQPIQEEVAVVITEEVIQEAE
jgi:hypothetical protein